MYIIIYIICVFFFFLTEFEKNYCRIIRPLVLAPTVCLYRVHIFPLYRRKVKMHALRVNTSCSYSTYLYCIVYNERSKKLSDSHAVHLACNLVWIFSFYQTVHAEFNLKRVWH